MNFSTRQSKASGDGCGTVRARSARRSPRNFGLSEFHNSHTGVSLLEWYRDLLRDKAQECLDEAVPVPDLAEQVENDPAVKTAKQAYEEAKAKAYAEARKRL